MESNQDIFDKLAEAESLSADDIIISITFEPFSFLIVQELKKLKSNIERNRLYESILNDERTVLLYEGGMAKTVMFPNHKTNDEYWSETMEMAFALNEYGIDVCFLPEVGDKLKGVKRADAIIKVNGKWSIVDFKYFHSTNDNTLGVDLEKGFCQASAVVLKVQNADLGIVEMAIDCLKGKKSEIGNVFFFNKYNKLKFISRKEILNDKYLNILRGFF